jgi:hypothetical protein
VTGECLPPECQRESTGSCGQATAPTDARRGSGGAELDLHPTLSQPGTKPPKGARVSLLSNGLRCNDRAAERVLAMPPLLQCKVSRQHERRVIWGSRQDDCSADHSSNRRTRCAPLWSAVHRVSEVRRRTGRSGGTTCRMACGCETMMRTGGGGVPCDGSAGCAPGNPRGQLRRGTIVRRPGGESRSEHVLGDAGANHPGNGSSLRTAGNPTRPLRRPRPTPKPRLIPDQTEHRAHLPSRHGWLSGWRSTMC